MQYGENLMSCTVAWSQEIQCTTAFIIAITSGSGFKQLREVNSICIGVYQDTVDSKPVLLKPLMIVVPNPLVAHCLGGLVGSKPARSGFDSLLSSSQATKELLTELRRAEHVPSTVEKRARITLRSSKFKESFCVALFVSETYCIQAVLRPCALHSFCTAPKHRSFDDALSVVTIVYSLSP